MFQQQLAAAKAGEAAALGALMENAATFCWRVLARFNTLSAATREDLAHEVVVTLLERGLAAFQGETEIQWKSYLKQAAIRRAISLMRHNKLEPPDMWLLEEEASPERTAEEQQAYQRLIDCTAELSAIDQEIFWMRVRELSYNEMVERLGLAQGTIASKYNRAQAKVTRCLEEVGLA